MGSNVFNFPTLTVPSFRRRSLLPGTPSQAGETWADAARQRAALRLIAPSASNAVSEQAQSHGHAAPSGTRATDEQCANSAGRPQALRVLRLVEAGQAPGIAGRLRLSGRLADVCAELDRMALAEHAGSRALRA